MVRNLGTKVKYNALVRVEHGHMFSLR